MSPRFIHYLKIVAFAHVLAVMVFLVASGWRRFFRPKPTRVLPVELRIAAPRETATESTPLPEAPVVRPPPPPPKPQPHSIPAPKPEKKPIVRSTKRVTRTLDAAPAPTVSEETIRKVLERGIELDDPTSAPDKDRLSLERIRRVLYTAWKQPSKEEAGQAVVRAEVIFDGAGHITGHRLIAPSGNAAMDVSVRRALRAVGRVEGLTAAFLERHSSVTISFKVE